MGDSSDTKTSNSAGITERPHPVFSNPNQLPDAAVCYSLTLHSISLSIYIYIYIYIYRYMTPSDYD